jgi:hypothetical protein
MKVSKRDGSVENEILTGMITHDHVVARIAPKWDKTGLFRNPWANVVGGWAVNFHNKYGKAPGRSVTGLFVSWSQKPESDQATVKIVERYLGSLSDKFVRLKKEINPDYVIDRAGEHFNEVREAKFIDALQGDRDGGDSAAFHKRVDQFSRIEIGSGGLIDLFEDRVALNQSFVNQSKVLVEYPGAAGEFFKKAFCRDRFIAFQAPDKTGKSFFLQDLAYRAVSQRRRVLYFEAGDLSRDQVIDRFKVRTARKPLDAKEVQWPTKIVVEGEEKVATPEITWERKKFTTGLSPLEAWKAFRLFKGDTVKSKDSYFKLSVHPNSSLGVSDIRSTVATLSRGGWVPDLVIVDYADILAPSPGYSESRDGINANWKKLRALSQEFHNLTVTATQTNAAAYKADVIDRSNFSEDKRKNAHVDGMVSINQKDEERDESICRLSWSVLRTAKFSSRRMLYVAQCLDLYQPIVRSCWRTYTEKEQE